MEQSINDVKSEITSISSLRNKKPTSKLFLLSITVNLILIIIIGLGTYFFKATSLPNDLDLWSVQNRLSTQAGDLGWYDLMYSATINGKILKFEGNKITVKNKQGKIGELMLNNSIEISGQDPQTKKTTRTKGLQDLRLDEEAVLIVKPSGKNFEVTSIGYLITVNKNKEATKSAKTN